MRTFFILACIAILAFSHSHAARAADGQILITQAKALAGGVTPGDAPGFPVSITLAGSYVLGSNLIVTPGQSGIVVNAVEVAIDLNGFTIAGARSLYTNGVLGPQRNLTVRNGTIRFFQQAGVISNGGALIAEHLRIGENDSFGIYDQGGDGVLRNNTLIANGIGITCTRRCHVEGNMISRNRSTGVWILEAGTVLGNSIFGNGSYGVYLNTNTIAGLGNNTILGHSQRQIFGSYRILFPNACTGVGC
jgi:hypothetical protein